jgi:hypothetical protein
MALSLGGVVSTSGPALSAGGADGRREASRAGALAHAALRICPRCANRRAYGDSVVTERTVCAHTHTEWAPRRSAQPRNGGLSQWRGTRGPRL